MYHGSGLPSRSTDRVWYRPNPPVNGVKWCIRSNINYQQSGVLIALRYVADHRQTFIANQVAKAERMVQRGRTSAPYAYVFPPQHNAGEVVGLVNLFRLHGAEVHTASEDFWATPKNGAPRDSVPLVPRHSYVIRMDQPYAAPVRTLLSIQKFKADDPPPYDDTGWTFGPLYNAETVRVEEVDWVEAQGNYVRLHASGASHLLREPLHRLEARLDPRRFVRVHRSAIVNLDRVREVQFLFRGEHVVIGSQWLGGVLRGRRWSGCWPGTGSTSGSPRSN